MLNSAICDVGGAQLTIHSNPIWYIVLPSENSSSSSSSFIFAACVLRTASFVLGWRIGGRKKVIEIIELGEWNAGCM